MPKSILRKTREPGAAKAEKEITYCTYFPEYDGGVVMERQPMFNFIAHDRVRVYDPESEPNPKLYRSREEGDVAPPVKRARIVLSEDERERKRGCRPHVKRSSEEGDVAPPAKRARTKRNAAEAEHLDGFDPDEEDEAPVTVEGEDDEEQAPTTVAEAEHLDGFDADEEDEVQFTVEGEGADDDDEAPPFLRRSARIAAGRSDANEKRAEAKPQKKARKKTSRPTRRSLRVSLSLSGGSVRKTRSGRVYGVIQD